MTEVAPITYEERKYPMFVTWFIVGVFIFFILLIVFLIYFFLFKGSGNLYRIELESLTQSFEVVSRSVKFDGEFLKFEVKKNPTSREVIGINYNIQNSSQNYTHLQYIDFADNETKEINISIGNFLNDIKKVSILPVFKLDNEFDCGNGLIQPNGGEFCDDGNINSGDGCSNMCEVEENWGCYGQPSICSQQNCGNGVREGLEECDGNDQGGETCQTLGLGTGLLSCYPLNSEESEGCKLDISSCSLQSVCGNNIQEGTEKCDGTDLDDETCDSLGYGAGTLSCIGSNLINKCNFNLSACTGCGNGVREGLEECDGSDYGSETCESLDLGTGNLICNPSGGANECKIVTSGCSSVPACTDSDDDKYNVSLAGCGIADCDDTNINVNPGATEICGDGLDNDCIGGDAICAPSGSIPVAYYSFDVDESGTGIISDDIGSNNGALFGATWTSSGRSGGAYSYDGVDDYIDLGTSSFNILSNNEFTIAVWINPTSQEGEAIDSIISRGQYVYPFSIQLDNQNKLKGGARTSGASPYVFSSSPIVYGNWIHVALSFTNGNLSLYVNGIPDSSIVKSGALSTTSANTTIGKLHNAGYYYHGVIDEVRIYDERLTSAEIKSLYDGYVLLSPSQEEIEEKSLFEKFIEWFRK